MRKQKPEGCTHKVRMVLGEGGGHQNVCEGRGSNQNLLVLVLTDNLILTWFSLIIK